MVLPKGPSYIARYLRRYAWQPVVFSGVFFVLAFAAVLYFLDIAATRENAAAREHSRHLAETAVGTIRDDMARRVVDYAWWNDMVAQVAKGLEPAWADSNIGSYLHDEFGYSGTYLLGPDLKTIYSYAAIPGLTKDAEVFLGDGGQAFLRRQQETSQARSEIVTAFVRNDDGVFLVALGPVTPEQPTPQQLRPHPRPLLMFHRRIDGALLADLGRKFLLDSLRLAPPGSAAGGIALAGMDGRPVVEAIWDQVRPGDSLLADLSLKVGLVMGALAVAAVLLAFLWARAAISADVAKSRFLAKMSHELLTPLNPIIGFAQVMRDQMAGPLAESYRDYAAHIHRSGSHLLAIVRDILDFSRIETGDLRLDEEAIDLSQLVRDLPPILAPGHDGAAPAPLAFRVDIDAGLPRLRADPLRVRQVLINILSNAAKFGDGREVTLRAMAVGGAIRIEVEDQGIGIAPEDVERAFEPFVQISPRRGPYGGQTIGTGIGLPIARELMELHGGSLDLAPGARGGTRAIIVFPAGRTIMEPVDCPGAA